MDRDAIFSIEMEYNKHVSSFKGIETSGTTKDGVKISWWIWIARSMTLAAALTVTGPKLAGIFNLGLLHQPSPRAPPPSAHEILGTAPVQVSQFVHRRLDRLYLGDKPFRFVSFNAPDLHVSEDNTWHRVTQYEQEDGLQAIARMGGQVVRIYPMSIVGGLNNGTYTHVLGKGKYNEELFQDLDRLLDIASKRNIRIIIPFIDHWEWWGGIHQFSALYNVNFRDFYRQKAVRDGFKDLIKYVLLRKNTVNGKVYRDDPHVLAWETGNELGFEEVESTGLPTRAEMDAWTTDTARYIKSLDPNHLVMDGRLLTNRDVSEVALEEPSIDLISDHFYPNTAYSFDDRLNHMLSFTKGKKPFIIGEFGLVIPITVEALLQRVADEPSIGGAMLWSLRQHNPHGGFYWHYEYDNYWAYHYPGWDSNNMGQERSVMETMQEYSYAVQGLPQPKTVVPGRPEILASSKTNAITWRGAVGAEHYELEREEVEGSDQWTKVSGRLFDGVNPFVPFDDRKARPDKAYRYRIYAVNGAGRSEASEPLLIDPPSTRPKPILGGDGSSPAAISLSTSPEAVASDSVAAKQPDRNGERRRMMLRGGPSTDEKQA